MNGLVAGAFDVIHPGYVRLLKDAASACDHLIVALHKDPSLGRPEKITPILSVDERTEILLAIRYVNRVVVYEREEELDELIRILDIGVRICGDDWQAHDPHPNLVSKTHYHRRNHDWSATKYRQLVADSWNTHKENRRGTEP